MIVRRFSYIYIFCRCIMRIGQGYDIHRTVKGRPLILGGVEIPWEKGLLGHSDADVLTHAVIDSIFGALADGDIGTHFPDNDDEYKDICSLVLLEKAVSVWRDIRLSNVINLDGMNEEEFKDWSKPFVHVTGEVNESRIQEIVTQPLSPTYASVVDRKVNELKETSGNRDVNNGASSAGITAASAIAALQ